MNDKLAIRKIINVCSPFLLARDLFIFKKKC